MPSPGAEPRGSTAVTGQVRAGPRALTAARTMMPAARIRFLGDPVWWALGLAGLAADIALRFAGPAVLAGSMLHGAGQWLSCVLWQPVIEEIAFRGLLQGELLRTRWGTKRLWHVTAANAVCSTAFMAMHFVHHPPLWAASVLGPSLIFGWVRERYGGPEAAIGLHILYNLEFFSAASLVLS